MRATTSNKRASAGVGTGLDRVRAGDVDIVAKGGAIQVVAQLTQERSRSFLLRSSYGLWGPTTMESFVR
jgi:hypothetical protein